MVLFIITFISILLAIILYKISGNLYTDYEGSGTDIIFPEKYKLKRPRWAVILLFIISAIPIVNIIIITFLALYIAFSINDYSLFFHSDSKIAKWLTENV